MSTKTVTYSVGRTLGQPNFGSHRVDISETAEIAPDQDPDEVFQQLRSRCLTRLIHEIETFTSKVPL